MNSDPSELDPVLSVDWEAVEAARAIDDTRDDWWPDQHPQLLTGSYGPDQLGNHYIHVSHAEQSVVESIDVSELPVEREHILAHGQRTYSSKEEHYTAIFRHARYYSEEESEPTIADERAEDIGFLGSNAGKRSVETDFRENAIPYEEIGSVELGSMDPETTLYRYKKAGETRYAVEWSERVAIDDYVIRSLIFNQEPDVDDVATALTIEDHRFDNVNTRSNRYQKDVGEDSL